jgi:hypothetical protein
VAWFGRRRLPALARVGFAIGAIVAGLIAHAASIASAIWVVAAIVAFSGLVVLIRMRERVPTSPPRPPIDTEGEARRWRAFVCDNDAGSPAV